jgi:hypothetical protein
VINATANRSAVLPKRFMGELTCLLCGRTLGTLDGGASWPPRGEALLYRPGSDEPTSVTGWWRLRCDTCGGALLATEIISRAMRIEAAVDWRTVGIRRGRPPNWLVAERAAADTRRGGA